MGFSVKMKELILPTLSGSRLNAEIREAERIGITGPNGSGKSSLIRFLACLERPSSMGQLLIDGKDPFHAHDMEALHGEIACLLQNPAGSRVFSGVMEDAVFGPENQSVRPEVIRKRWNGLQERLLGGKISENADQRKLSHGQQQKTALLSNLMMRAPLLLLDEPFSMMGKKEAGELFTFLMNMAERLKQTLVMVTRDPELLMKMDRVFVLKQGRLEELVHREGQWFYRGEEDPCHEEDLREFFTEEKEEPGEQETEGVPAGPRLIRVGRKDTREVYSPVIRMDQVCFRYGREQVIHEFSATVYPGIYYELHGPVGCGKSTLCKLMNGTLLADSGEIRIKEDRLPLRKERNGGLFQKGNEGLIRARQTVGLVLQNPEEQLFCNTVLEDVMFGPLRAGLTKEEARTAAEEALTSLGVEPALWKRRPQRLSGGEMRRVAIAGILARRPEVLILDEPFAGLDSEGREILEKAFREIVAMGRTVIVTGH